MHQALFDDEAATDNNCGRAVKFEGTYGAEFQGGHGAEYGGGGGGGYFGGGGGGTMPGVAGGGGGGSCYVREFDENGKPFELADHPARKRLAALQPSARQRCRRPSRSSPKPFAHSTPMLHIVHLVRLLYIPTTPTTPPTPPPHLATVLPY